MASLDQYPPRAVCEYLNYVLSKSRMKDGKLAGQLQHYASVEEARNFYAAMKHLEVIAMKGSKEEDVENSVARCLELMRRVFQAIKSQADDDKVIIFDRQDLLLLSETEIHIDRYALSKEVTNVPRKYPSKKGGRK